MASQIDPSTINDANPVTGNPTTASVRQNFTAIKTALTHAKTEIDAAGTGGAAEAPATISPSGSPPPVKNGYFWFELGSGFSTLHIGQGGSWVPLI